MKRLAVPMALLLAGGCADRPQHPIPYIPPNTQYSTGSTLMAAGGLMMAAVGSSIADSPSASRTAKTVGTATMATGLGLAAASLIDAIEVQGARKTFIDLTRAFYNQYYGGGALEEKERVAPEAIPEIPFQFKEDPPPDDP